MRDSKLFCDDGRTRGPAPTGNDDVFDLGLKKLNIFIVYKNSKNQKLKML